MKHLFTAENSIQLGKYSIPSPCTVPEEALRRLGNGKQFCQDCQKVVHDISGMEPREIDALWKKSGGKMCAAFLEENPPLTKNKPRKFSFRLSPSLLSGAAAAATLTTFLLEAPTTFAKSWMTTEQIYPMPAYGAPDCLVRTNVPMLLSTVILNQYDENIADDIVIKVELPSGKMREITTSAGFFSLNLEGLAECEEYISINILPQKFEDGSSSRTYPAATFRVLASEAQNQTVKCEVAYIYKRMNRGDMRR